MSQSSRRTGAEIPGSRTSLAVAYLWIAVVIFAAANSVIRLLTDIGTQNPIDGRNPISFCNVLFVGNLCACATLSLIYRRSWTRAELSRLDRGDWASLLLLAILSGALGPALFFLALENTTVTNVVLMGRLEPLMLILCALLFLGERPRLWILAAAILPIAGIAIAFALLGGEGGGAIGKGELQAAAGTVVLAISTVLSKRRLERIPLGIFTVVRSGLGAVIFFIVAAILFGPTHFMDVFSPLLWQGMLVYGGLVIVGGQLFWFNGLKHSSGADVSLATSFSPLAAMALAFLIVGEEPGPPVLIAGAFILAGIAVGQIGEWRRRREEARPASRTDEAVAAEGEVTFKGV